MADVIYVAVTVAFLGLCVLYVRGCERIIASSDDDSETAR